MLAESEPVSASLRRRFRVLGFAAALGRPRPGVFGGVDKYCLLCFVASVATMTASSTSCGSIFVLGTSSLIAVVPDPAAYCRPFAVAVDLESKSFALVNRACC
jgi:hypothetical protein